MFNRQIASSRLLATISLAPLALSVATALAVCPRGTIPAQPQSATCLLDPVAIPKYVDDLVIPPVMPRSGVAFEPGAGSLQPIDLYEIQVTQFRQQILPTAGFNRVTGLPSPTGTAPFPRTAVWSYSAVGRPETRNYPAFTIEAQRDRPVRVKWVNNLVDAQGNFLPHLLKGRGGNTVVDQTLHWANPPQTCKEPPRRTDCEGNTARPYNGPVPLVTHVHGAHVRPESDGYPEAWFLPNARNIPAGFARRGSHFDQIAGAPNVRGAAFFQYPNDQPATTLWYHDHALGMTRLNVYAGPAGFYLLRDRFERAFPLPGPAPRPGDDPNGDPLVRAGIHEIPIVIQDRSFKADGSLFYPDNRDFFEGFPFGTLADLVGIRFAPRSDVPPIWNPEFFGNTIVVNGKTWPKLDVEPRKYRFRLLNGTNGRVLILRFNRPLLTFTQIGAEEGFLPRPVVLFQLLMGPAERADVVVDFSNFNVGEEILLLNAGPDEPFGGGVAGVDFEPADRRTTGQVMKFVVVPRTGRDTSSVPRVLSNVPPVDPFARVRRVSLNEASSATETACFGPEGELVVPRPLPCRPPNVELPFGPTMAQLGVLDPARNGVPLRWADPITENPRLNATETWEIYNLTADSHPIHLHLVRFQVVNRQSLVADEEGVAVQPARLLPGTVRAPEAWETGFKDTVLAHPGEVTRIQATFDIPGLYVWHCHIVEHEDNEMMRSYCVGGQRNCSVLIAPGA